MTIWFLLLLLRDNLLERALQSLGIISLDFLRGFDEPLGLFGVVGLWFCWSSHSPTIYPSILKRQPQLERRRGLTLPNELFGRSTACPWLPASQARRAARRCSQAARGCSCGNRTPRDTDQDAGYQPAGRRQRSRA